MKVVIALAVAIVFALPAGVASQETKSASHSVIMPDAVRWGPAPPFMPPGSQLAIMHGDPTKSELFIIRGKLPDGYTIPPHWHSTAENVTVLSGVFNVGMGDKLDKSKGQALAAGGFFSAPPHMTHFAWATGETVVEVTGVGPLDFKYVDPKDDPTKAGKTD